MATFTELSFVIRKRGPLTFVRKIVHEVNNDAVLTNAAAIAYAWMFALFPFFIFLLSLVPYLPAQFRQNAITSIRGFVNDELSPDAANLILANVESVMTQHQGGLLSIGLILTLYAASGGMNMLMSALDTAYEVPKPRNYFVRRLVAVGLTLLTATCVIVVTLVLPIGAAVKLWVDARYPGQFTLPMEILYVGVRYAVGLMALQTMLTAIYHWGTSYRQKIKFFSPGVVFAMASWLLTGFGLRYYFSNFADYSKTYGTVAGMIILLLILYIDSVVMLVGAEINSEIDLQSKELAGAFASDDHATSRPHG